MNWPVKSSFIRETESYLAVKILFTDVVARWALVVAAASAATATRSRSVRITAKGNMTQS